MDYSRGSSPGRRITAGERGRLHRSSSLPSPVKAVVAVDDVAADRGKEGAGKAEQTQEVKPKAKRSKAARRFRPHGAKQHGDELEFRPHGASGTPKSEKIGSGKPSIHTINLRIWGYRCEFGVFYFGTGKSESWVCAIVWISLSQSSHHHETLLHDTDPGR
ncbi:hypothetical protein Dimus_014123, partial [Dionaea muscipula]